MSFTESDSHPSHNETARASEDARPTIPDIADGKANPSDSHKSTDLEQWKLGVKERLVLLTCMISTSLVALDANVLVTILATIGRELDIDAIGDFWIGTSYFLACTVTQVFVASISDIFGRRSLLVISLTLFTAGTLVACTAYGLIQILVGRTLQGIGCGGITSMVAVLIVDILPLRYRPRYLGLISLVWALGGIAGPIIGGGIAHHTTWRLIFYINFPFCVLAAAGAIYAVKLRRRDAFVSTGQKVRAVDWVGLLLLTSGLSAFLIGVTWGGVQFAWGSAATLIPVILGSMIVILGIFWEKARTEHALIRLSLFTTRSGLVLNLLSLLHGFLLFAQLFYYTLWLQSVRGLSPVYSGVGLLAISISMCPTAAVTGAIITRIGRYRPFLWAGWILLTTGTGMTIHFDDKVGNQYWIGTFILVGFGNGLLLSSLPFTAQVVAKPADMAFAASTFMFLRTLGSSLGVAVGGVVVQNVIASQARAGRISIDVAMNATTYINNLDSLPPQIRSQVILAYLSAFRTLFEVMTAVSALCAILSLLIENFRLEIAFKPDYTFDKNEEGNEDKSLA